GLARVTAAAVAKGRGAALRRAVGADRAAAALAIALGAAHLAGVERRGDRAAVLLEQHEPHLLARSPGGEAAKLSGRQFAHRRLHDPVDRVLLVSRVARPGAAQ